MPYSLSFRNRHAYEPSDQAISLPVSLNTGGEKVQLFANLDTGAQYCFFDRGFAQSLGIEVERGIELDCKTVTGGFRAYGHELILTALDFEFSAIVYFYENPAITRNVLGRNGWLNRVRLALVDPESLVYLSPYSD